VNIFPQVNPQEAGQQRGNHNLIYNHCLLNITRTLKDKTKAMKPILLSRQLYNAKEISALTFTQCCLWYIN